MTALVGRDQTHLERSGVRQRTLVVDCAGVRITDFGIAPDERDALVEEGRRAAGEFVQRWRASGGV
ncbi:hypothetical protein ABCR94_28675 [Streptomyces sp. 21So2-11]|uniref:hypothetical protein n=1 Tax=Streptomyces sp. 21So2-11 TaxID=3144408 RepID=UPI0032198F94